MSSTAIAKVSENVSLAERMGYDAEKLEFIRAEIASGAPNLKLEYFLSFCKAKGLDPTARQVYYIRRDKSVKVDGQWIKEPTWTIQIGIDGFRSLAEASGEYDGQDDPEFKYDDQGRLLAATVRVYRKGMAKPVPGTAFFDEYVQTDRDGAPNSMWKRMPHSQLGKCAEALALRKAFPSKLGGLYTNDEMGQADSARYVTPIRAVETPPARVAEPQDVAPVVAEEAKYFAPGATAATAAQTVPVVDPDEEDDEDGDPPLEIEDRKPRGEVQLISEVQTRAIESICKAKNIADVQLRKLVEEISKGYTSIVDGLTYAEAGTLLAQLQAAGERRR